MEALSFCVCSSEDIPLKKSPNVGCPSLALLSSLFESSCDELGFSTDEGEPGAVGAGCPGDAGEPGLEVVPDPGEDGAGGEAGDEGDDGDDGEEGAGGDGAGDGEGGDGGGAAGPVIVIEAERLDTG